MSSTPTPPERPTPEPTVAGLSWPPPPRDDAEAGLSATGRYRVLGELGRGGMGLVLHAHDADLDRELAVKVILSGGAGPEERFLDEARLTGQLQHPGVAPVYEVGRLPDGRPFFTMKLVRGRGLDALLRERPSPAHDLPRFLLIVEQACQAVAYAHGKGVIHRDLKPANVLVGEHGEVQVVDWGLARRLAPDEPRPSGSGQAEGRSLTVAARVGATQLGAVLGTPAYMPPEQAAGRAADRRSDVFGLGAILCEVLTGLPPYAGAGAVAQAAAGAPGAALARLAACGADAELTALARQCLAAAPEERPPDAGAVAERLAAYRAGVAERLRKAEVERAAAEVKAAAERRSRRLTLALAAAVVAAVGLGSGAAWYIHAGEERRERERLTREAELAVLVEHDLSEAEKDLAAAPDEARAALGRAQARLGDGEALPELRRRAAAMAARIERRLLDRAVAAEVEEARLQAAEAGPGGFDRAGAEKRFAAAFARYGVDVDGPLGTAAAALRASAVRAELLAGLGAWARARSGEGRARLLRLADLADDDGWHRELRRAYLRRDAADVSRLARLPEAEGGPPEAVVLLAYALQEAGLAEQARDALRRGLERRPADFWLAFELAVACHEGPPELLDEAVRAYMVARALRPGSAVVHSNLSAALRSRRRPAEAEAAARAAVALRPDYAAAHVNLGVALCDRLKLADAEAALRRAVRLNPDLPEAHNNLGVVLRLRGRPADAEAVLREAVRLGPADAEGHSNLGLALFDQKKWDEAESALRRAVQLRPGAFEAHANLAAALRARGEMRAALASLRRALDLARAQGRQDEIRPEGVAELERLVGRIDTVAEVLAGARQPGPAELCEHAEVCSSWGLSAAAAWLYARAFAAAPELAGDNAYDAACAAARAARGRWAGEAERACLRSQALLWLDAALAGAAADLAGDAAARLAALAALRRWQQDPDLAGLRGAALAGLPEDERRGWERLWSAVAELLGKAGDG
jgi:serine/threonine-protein kinase